jgi:hypothetical protein
MILVMGTTVLGVNMPASAETLDELKSRLSTEVDASADASDALKAFAKDVLIPLCTNAVFVQGVKDQNAKGISLDDIKKQDEEWVNAEEPLPIHDEKMGNASAKEIEKLVKQHNAIVETFVMDNQGANVGQNELTSDYWQGDEAKWTESFNDAKGGVHIDKAKLDKSTNMVDQKVALPIVDEGGKIIGAVCYGLNPDKL